jgi:SAM-dependent methyltransferase
MISSLGAISCVICGNICVKDLDNILRCSECGLLHSGQKAGFGNPIQGMGSIALRNYATVGKALEKVLPLCGAKILDVGCAEGGFTELMLSKGADCLGLEPDKDAARDAFQKKLPVKLISFESFVAEEGMYDAIVFNDVFEHMQNPISVLEKSHKILKDNGYILINIPFSSGMIFKLIQAAARFGIYSPYRRMWARGLSSPHVYFYNQYNLSYLLKNFKFEFVEKGRLVSLSSDGMYRRVRSTYGPLSAAIISAFASLFMLILNLFPSDVNYLLFKKNE